MAPWRDRPVAGDVECSLFFDTRINFEATAWALGNLYFSPSVRYSFHAGRDFCFTIDSVVFFLFLGVECNKPFFAFLLGPVRGDLPYTDVAVNNCFRTDVAWIPFEFLIELAGLFLTSLRSGENSCSTARACMVNSNSSGLRKNFKKTLFLLQIIIGQRGRRLGFLIFYKYYRNFFLYLGWPACGKTNERWRNEYK